MFKGSLKFAIGPSLGIALGGVIIPRLMKPYLYNETYPPILVHATMYLIGGYIVSVLVFMIIGWTKSKLDAER